ncbi:hypothetical protein Tsubulata_008089 [Turnera subulata]|uniref:Structure-specific endonuclease subunit SLX1 homolog n=1 Tax=Turnera subulata TaxID=218843 RepID=A0A9Q0J439_9ROSI|nr:hypothetical protein Tsubulata_008089 [Turnera subulata]
MRKSSSLDTWKRKKKQNPLPKTAKPTKNDTQSPPETLLVNPQQQQQLPTQDQTKTQQGKGFFACYLLTSLCPRFKGHTYIGFTVNPRRRIRQHNGEIGCGAFRTKKRRPWEMVLCIYGFPTNVSALQFEWAWQHPRESVNVREAAAAFKTFSGVANKIKLAYTMLNLPAWSSLGITVNYFSTKYTNHSGGCPSLPQNMKVKVCPMDELPCYTETSESFSEGEDADEDWENEVNEDTTDTIRNSDANLVSLQPSFMDECLSYNGRGQSLLQDGYSKHDKHSEEDSSRNSSNTDGTVGETNASEEIHTSTDYAQVLDTTSFEQSELFKEYYRMETEDRMKPSDQKEHEHADDNHGTVKEKNADVTTHTPAGYAHNSIDKTSYGQFGKFNETGRRESNDPPTMDLDDVQPYRFINSPARAASPRGTSISSREIGDVDMFTTIDDGSPELSWQRLKTFTRKPVDTLKPDHSYTSPKEIEVIDLLSPTSEYVTQSSRKKRKVLSVVPEIIDLT